MTLTVGSLFSGIGGIDLGLERAGMQIAWQVEIDEWCRRVLAKHWPDVKRCDDVRLAHGWGDWCESIQDNCYPFGDVECEYLLPTVDVLAGGFPCQPVSLAGARRGQMDERWLWPEFARLVRELRPRYVLMENVPGLLAPIGVRGDDRRVVGYAAAPVEEVLGDLAACGYDAEWDCIPAAAVGAPHIRDRVWIVGTRNCPYSERRGLRDAGRRPSDRTATRVQGAEPERERLRPDAESVGHLVANAAGEQPEQPEGLDSDALLRARARAGGRSGGGDDPAGGVVDRRASTDGSQVSPDTARIFGRTRLCQGEAWTGEGRLDLAELADSRWWAVEPDVGRVAPGVPARVDRLRGLGNAVVPQVVELIGRWIAEDAERNSA